MVVLPDAFLASVGAMTDSQSLVLRRFDHLVAEPDKSPPQLDLTVLSMDGKPVSIDANIDWPVDRAIGPDDTFDFVWLPSFRIGSIEGLRDRLAQSQRLADWLRNRRALGAIIGASGAAAMYLVEARLLDRRPVPVSRVFLPTVRALFPRCQADDKLRVADHDGVIVSSGIGNDFAAIALAMSRAVSPYTGRWLAAVTSQEGAEARQLAKDPLVANAQMWIEQQYASDFRIADLAARLSTSHQTLIRRFRAETGMTPKAYVQQLRIAIAEGLLKTTHLPIDTIARFAGFSHARVFREHFRKSAGTSASVWKQLQRLNEKNHPPNEH